MSVDTTFVSFLLCYYAVGLFFCDATVVIITEAGRHRRINCNVLLNMPFNTLKNRGYKRTYFRKLRHQVWSLLNNEVKRLTTKAKQDPEIWPVVDCCGSVSLE